ncbi:ADP-ribosylglycohydrolase family protein [Diplocloster modestus]|uniref:ADP-ribosylglycohydrolase family protein n=1 Tax=Diplocloster modestus TaxID=2850322 RepID=A0ABS6K4Y6_9FIRM|nr:ADP-ribosylglycohydrolase family protein [Diplocloster modestus]MBU9725567.1 ADP-ribosylglycohydrolase family protein [Diplocloster modestus]
MELTFKSYRDKVLGCWAGKNIGGVLGAPFECMRQVNDVEFYTQDLSMGPPPNDDLDLQIIWLAAVEKYGRNVNASILGEYWLAYVIPNWAEYGTSKANLRAGLRPPLSGVVNNPYKDSCGCFIRSEIWACLAPGHPDIAVRYAYEDAVVDHEGEGMYGEIFFAALQSAAFIISDCRTLINIGLSYIPDDSMMSRAIRKAVDCYDRQVEIKEARKQIHNTAPGTFGIQGQRLKDIKTEGNEGMELGAPGFDAPENVAFVIAGWLYGNGDFGESLIIANSMGEDTDCTCATLGATLGIILGDERLPERWKAPLNDKIATMCIDKTSAGIWVPDTASELTDRVIRVMPAFLGLKYCDILKGEQMEIICGKEEDLYAPDVPEYLPELNSQCKDGDINIKELISLSPYVVKYEFPAFRMLLDYEGSIFFKKGENKKIKVKVFNAFYLNQQQWIEIKAYVPAGVEMLSSKCVQLPLNNLSGSAAETEFELNADGYEGGKLEISISVSLIGRHSNGTVTAVLMRGNQ